MIFPRRRVHVFVLLLLAGDGAAAAPPPRGPLVPRDPQAKPCTYPTDDLSGTVTLDGRCVYSQSFVIAASNTALDCAGALLTGSDGRSLLIKGQIENVTVSNCYIRDTRGIRVSPPKRLPGETDDQLRTRSPKNVLITNVSVTNTIGTGMFIGPHVVGVTVQDSTVEQASSAGIYLEYGTQHTVLRNNLLRDNGFRLANGLPTAGWYRREGVAVDAAAFNVIEGNTFEGNAFGGLFLYKNCWEYHSIDKNSEQRHQHARDNIIRGNTFRDMPVGVWIAARQARDLGSWDCGDPSPYPNPIALAEAFPPGYPTFRSTFPAPYDYSLEYILAQQRGVCPPRDDCSPNRTTVYIWEDYAEDNTVEDNRFEDLSLVGVRVEDDGARVVGNLFVGDFDHVFVGTPFRSRYLDHPVIGTVIRGNSFHATAGDFSQLLALVPGEQVATQVADNHRACVTPWGEIVAHGARILTYETERVDPGKSCRAEWRACADGKLGGSFVHRSCRVAAAPDAGPTADGDVDGGDNSHGGDSGCGCHAGADPVGAGGAASLVLLVLLALGRRRRCRRAVSATFVADTTAETAAPQTPEVARWHHQGGAQRPGPGRHWRLRSRQRA